MKVRSSCSSHRLRNHSRNLIDSLAANRRNENSKYRPLIFVVHSLGGILCKDVLNVVRIFPDAHLLQIYRSSRSFIFLDTPHTGSTLEHLARVPVSMLGIVRKASKDLLSILAIKSEVAQ
jgi:protein SERAC1